MDCSKTINFLYELQRLCDSSGPCRGVLYNKEDCPMVTICSQIKTHGQVFAQNENAKKAIEIVQKWSNEHSKKTYAQDFFEKFPDAPKDEAVKGKCPWACRIGIYGGGCPKIEPEIDSCYECWNELMEE